MKFGQRTFTVASGATSGSIKLEETDVHGLDVPTLTSATLKLVVSMDGSTWRDVYDGGGTQVCSWSASTGARAFSTLDLVHVAGYPYLGVVCGAAQVGDKTFTLHAKAPRRNR